MAREKTAKEKIVIANCGGFWGDDPTAARRQVEGGPVDYLVMDYLAEVTMAILQKQRQKNPSLGYASDFVRQLRDVLPACAERGIRVVSNAGGVNPVACKEAVEALAEELGLADRIKVGVVLGDDIYDGLADQVAAGQALAHMDSGAPLQPHLDRVLSANVYLGAVGVVRALELGADIVIAGRVTDTSVTLAPMMFEFGWSADDWDRIAAGVVAGHIIECGAQCTGGNFTDWHKVPSYLNMGYPLVEAHADGSFVVTKHPGTGGLITEHTISEQLLYEMGAPSYLSPDCTARFDTIELSQEGDDRVRIAGIRGEPPPPEYKVSISTADGYRAFGRLMISGPRAVAKATRVADTIRQIVADAGYEEFRAQLIGHDSTHPSIVHGEPGEVLLQVAVRDADRRKIQSDFAVRVVPMVLASVPGITVLSDQGRPRASEVVGYWPALIAREQVPVSVQVGAHAEDVDDAVPHGRNASPVHVPDRGASFEPTGTPVQVPLEQLCLSRSGDKGDTCNVGLLARSPEIYTWLKANITARFVAERFASLTQGRIDRHEVPNILALNFLVHESLGGGGTMSLLVDPQGKTYAQFMLATEVEVDRALLDSIPPSARAA
ncbi:MAG: acyclic terpene utilization AtuA family protein [Pseudomonadota bacterium]